MEYCTEFEALLDLYADGELSAEEMIRVQAHLDACPACRAYVDDLLAIRAAFPLAEETMLPDGFTESVMARVRESAVPVKKTAYRAQWKKLLVPLAACCVVAVLAIPLSGMLNGAKTEAAPMAPAAGMVMMDNTVAECAAEDVAVAEEAPAEPVAPMEAAETPAAPVDESIALYTAKATAQSTEEHAADLVRAVSSALKLTAEEAGDLLDGCELAVESESELVYYLQAEEFDALLIALAEAGIETVPEPIDGPFFTVTILK